MKRRSRLVLITLGVAVLIAASAVLAGRLPTALARSRRANQVTQLQTSISAAQAGSDALASQVAKLQDNVDAQLNDNAALNTTITAQAEHIAALQREEARLKT